MTIENSKKSPENIKSKLNIEGEIESLVYKFLKKYSTKKETLEKLANFETSKGLNELKKEVKKLKDSGELQENIDIQTLFNDLKILKKEIQKISQNQIETLKKQIENNFSPNKKYDLAEQIKQKNPKLYQVIVSPKGLKQNIISAGFGVGNSLYKTGVGLRKLIIDFFRLLTFQVSLNDIKEQFKRV